MTYQLEGILQKPATPELEAGHFHPYQGRKKAVRTLAPTFGNDLTSDTGFYRPFERIYTERDNPLAE